MVAVTSVLLSERLTVQVAGGVRLGRPGKRTWGAQPSSLSFPELLPVPTVLRLFPSVTVDGSGQARDAGFLEEGPAGPKAQPGALGL